MTTASTNPSGPSLGAAGAPGAAKTSGLAIASLVAGLLGLWTAGLGSLAGLILGIVAQKKIRRSGGEVAMTRENGMLTFRVAPKDQHPPITVAKLSQRDRPLPLNRCPCAATNPAR